MNVRPVAVLSAVAVIGVFTGSYSLGQESSRSSSVNDSVYTAALYGHLRNNFDDIHDVSMRFHHMDHRLNGIIQLRMHWENGRMVSSSVVRNETSNEEFGRELLKSIGRWHIEALKDPFDIDLPLRIMIVGSDDSTFSEKGILTGEIHDTAGAPVKRVRLSFRSAANPGDTLRTCYSNREGIFVKTLIPAGDWNVEAAADGYEKVLLSNVRFKKGEHVRKRIMLRPAQ
jgi:hypothetical protein